MSAELEDFFTMADVNLTLDLRMEVTEQTTHRVRKYGFGDGYEAVAKDGINTRQTEYSVTTVPSRLTYSTSVPPDCSGETKYRSLVHELPMDDALPEM